MGQTSEIRFHQIGTHWIHRSSPGQVELIFPRFQSCSLRTTARPHLPEVSALHPGKTGFVDRNRDRVILGRQQTHLPSLMS